MRAGAAWIRWLRNTVLRKTALAAAVAILAIIVYATLVPISLRPSSGHVHPERVLAFFALGATFSVAFPRRWAWVVVAVVVIACGLEYAQTFIPTRDGRMLDAVEKSAGGLTGVGLGLVFSELAERMAPWLGPRTRGPV